MKEEPGRMGKGFSRRRIEFHAELKITEGRKGWRVERGTDITLSSGRIRTSPHKKSEGT